MGNTGNRFVFLCLWNTFNQCLNILLQEENSLRFYIQYEFLFIVFFSTIVLGMKVSVKYFLIINPGGIYQQLLQNSSSSTFFLFNVSPLVLYRVNDTDLYWMLGSRCGVRGLRRGSCQASFETAAESLDFVQGQLCPYECGAFERGQGFALVELMLLTPNHSFQGKIALGDDIEGRGCAGLKSGSVLQFT